MSNNFESLLSGGHPNSLGNTVSVVTEVLEDKSKFAELFDCYHSQDETVRLRVSNAMKRVAKEKPQWVAEYLDRFLKKVTKLDQASAQWTLSQLFLSLESYLTPKQKGAARRHMQYNLATHTDWIVISQTMNTLVSWSKTDPELQKWLRPHLERLTRDTHKPISKKAQKFIDTDKKIHHN